MRYSSVPAVIQGHGVWAAAGFNEANVGMSATETITSNERVLTSVLSHRSFELPDNPMHSSSVPDVIQGHGVWAAAGFNEANVGMSATETITSNERVLGADPLVEYVPAHGEPGDPDYTPEVPGGLSEEDFVTVVLPYIHSAREGVQRLGRPRCLAASPRRTSSPSSCLISTPPARAFSAWVRFSSNTEPTR